MPFDLPLVPLQNWMQTVIEHPGDVWEALDNPAAKRWVADVADVILPSKTLDPGQRVGVYHGMYMLRMVEAMQTDYPAILQFLGEHAFEHLVTDYVQVYPSRSWTFNRLGDHLPEFIAASKMRRRVFLTDLARFELAMTEVFDETEVEPLAADAIGAIGPEALDSLFFKMIPALRLLPFEYDVASAFRQYRDGEQIQPVRRKTWIALHRRDYGVFRMPLTQTAFVFLRALSEGKTIGDALMAFHRRFRRLPEQHELYAWFRDWSAAGLFASMETR